jgi:predicted dienelactone hydrolase
VGVRTLTLVDRNAIDVLHTEGTGGAAPRRDRTLTVDLWYPATPNSSARAERYRDSLSGENGKPVAFELPGLAVRGAQAVHGRFPLVVVSHGYGNVTIAMSWLTENLASKGYVVAAIRHLDPYTDPRGFPEVLMRRPLDIAFVARSLQDTLATEGLIDPTRVALIGYSMGGYGVLTAAGAELDPKGRVVAMVPGGLLAPYAQGGASAADIKVAHLKAVVAISPAGGSLAAWGSTGFQAREAPLFLISGDHDRTVDYASGARAFFDAAVNAPRYLLTFKGGGHALGLGPAPPQMRLHLWDLDWFEDPVWRKDRLIGINLHMITAFLDRYVKGDGSKAAYLDGLVPDSSSGNWTQAPGAPWDAISPGTGEITVWKGFQRKHAEGLELLHADAANHSTGALK